MRPLSMDTFSTFFLKTSAALSYLDNFFKENEDLLLVDADDKI